MHNIAVTFNLTPVLQSQRDWRLSQLTLFFYKIQYYLSRSRLNDVLFVLEIFRERKKMNDKFRWHYISVWSIIGCIISAKFDFHHKMIF